MHVYKIVNDRRITLDFDNLSHVPIVAAAAVCVGECVCGCVGVCTCMCMYVCVCAYGMAGNFRVVLIFVIFVVDSSVMKSNDSMDLHMRKR